MIILVSYLVLINGAKSFLERSKYVSYVGMYLAYPYKDSYSFELAKYLRYIHSYIHQDGMSQKKSLVYWSSNSGTYVRAYINE